MKTIHTDILIIGAGPSGSVAAGILRRNTDKQLLVLERSEFPRFSIGESLLPQSMAYFEEAGMLQAIVESGFQYKNGAKFAWKGEFTEFDFREKFSPGWGTTYQVQRATFDDVLIKEAIKQGVDVRFKQEVTAIDVTQGVTATVVDHNTQETYTVTADFVLDASGFGRTLPRLLDLNTPSSFPPRQAIFTHVEDHISDSQFDRNKILISVHPEHRDVWYWSIPFSNGRCSIGVVAEQSFFEARTGDNEEKLRQLLSEQESLAVFFKDAQWPMAVQTIVGYSADVKTLSEKHFALLGNAGEFLDPIFSSGITIAVKSASLAANCLIRRYKGETVDWKKDYDQTLQSGVHAFKTYVEAWYEGTFQDVIFAPNQDDKIRAMISSILAGYAWDRNNPFVDQPQRRFNALHALIKGDEQPC